MARRTGKRRGRRRSGGVISRQLCPRIDPEHTRWVLSSSNESRKAGEEYRRAKAEGNPGQRLLDKVQKESVEIYVGNVPVRTTAGQLALHLHAFLLRKGFGDDSGSPVLKCMVQPKRGSPVTYAFVRLRSKEVATAIVGARHNSFRGRELSAKLSKSPRMQPVAASPGFGCLAFQLCAEWPPNELTCLWEATSCVRFQITGPTSLARLMFQDDRGNKCQADFKRRHVDGEVKIEKHRGKTWLVFRLLRPPFLKANPESTASNPFLQAFLAMGKSMDGSRSVWELGAAEEGEDAEMERVGDVSPSRAFGRCLVYRVDVSELAPKDMSRLCKELYAFRLCGYESEARLIRPPVPVHTVTSRTALDGWEATDRARALYRDLPYRVKFMIKSLVSNLKVEALGMNEYAMALLAEAGEERACLVLRAMLHSDPRRRLGRAPADEIMWWCSYFGPRTGVAQVTGRGNVMVPRASLTPLRLVCQPPEEEMSNGVTRRFKQHCERFLRVSFVDENLGRIPTPLSKTLKERIRQCLNKGLVIGGRRYEFLAYSGSQLRSHSCFFYACPNGKGNSGANYDTSSTYQYGEAAPTAAFIRQWMGDLSGIDVVGKHAARLGQNLSSSRLTVAVLPNMRKEVPDKKSGPYEFTDGCGMMSQDLARRVADSLRLAPDEDTPSAFQIRMGGCKGMLVVWPDSVMEQVAGRSGYSMIVRPSMQKFPSDLDDLGASNPHNIISA